MKNNPLGANGPDQERQEQGLASARSSYLYAACDNCWHAMSQWQVYDQGNSTCPKCKRGTMRELEQMNIPTPAIGAKLLCLVCAYYKPWGIFDSRTAVSVCVECRDKAQRPNSTTRQDDLVDEVQRRMDVVVNAAVEWHQSADHITDIFDKAAALGDAIDSLLELRDPTTQSTASASAPSTTVPDQGSLQPSPESETRIAAFEELMRATISEKDAEIAKLRQRAEQLQSQVDECSRLHVGEEEYERRWRNQTAQNTKLRTQLAAAEARVKELQRELADCKAIRKATRTTQPTSEEGE